VPEFTSNLLAEKTEDFFNQFGEGEGESESDGDFEPPMQEHPKKPQKRKSLPEKIIEACETDNVEEFSKLL
jgi:hypothetical protein